MKNIALIGCGAIGSSVLELLSGDTRLQVGWVLVPEITPAVRETAARLAPQAQLLQALPSDAVPDLLVECAGHAAIEEHVLPALARGIPAVIASIGALSAPGMAERVQAAAEAGNTQAQLLSGAIGGIDALAAARVGGGSIKVWRADVATNEGALAEPGTVVAADKSGIVVACGQGALCLTELQKAGGKRLPVAQFLAGTTLAAGTRFDLAS